MGIAMMALIAFQYHWILRDIRLGTANFERNVRYALNNVLEQYLEHQITSKNHFVFNTSITDFSVDSLHQFYIKRTGKNSLQTPPNLKVKTGYTYSFNNSGNSSSQNISVIVEDIGIEGDSAKKAVFTQVVERIEEVEEDVKQVVDIQVADCEEETKIWALNSLKIDRPHIDFGFLQTQLAEELTQQGLSLPYGFALIDTVSNKVLHQNEGFEYTEEVVKDGFQLALIGNQSGSLGEIMLIHFPSKNDYLLKELSQVLIASFALIAIVATCFWFAIRTILRQKRLSEIKNDFINNMTHEFKTPISNVSLAIEALQSFGMMAKPETTQKYLDIAKNENSRLGKQVEKVLQMALLEKEEFKLKIKPISFHDIVEEVISSFKLQVEQKGGSIQTELRAANDLLEADELHLTNVLFNLVDNATKYSPENPEITIQTENTQEGLKIAVIDKGIGIAKDQISRIFQKFYRVPTGNLHNVKGFGLGLSYVGQIVQKHQGQIDVRSQYQQGSRFEIILPYKQL